MRGRWREWRVADGSECGEPTNGDRWRTRGWFGEALQGNLKPEALDMSATFLAEAQRMSGELVSRRPIDAVTEREIDLLLLMVLHCSPGFRAFLASKTAGAGDFEFLGAWRGVYDNLGESDLLVLLNDAKGRRVAVMIEDKIDAAFQRDQASRYRQRGEQGRVLRKWDRFVTCLCAPNAYAEGVGKKAWDAILTYEEIEANLAAQNDTFAPFVRAALNQGAERQRNGGFVASEQASAFWAQYRHLQREEFPDIKMTALREVQSVNDPWPRFAAGTLPPRVKLEHKPWKGCVDLTLQDIKFEDLWSRLDGCLPAKLEVCRTAPSSAVRATVPPINATEPFEPQTEAVREVFRAVQALLRLWPRIRETSGFPPSEPVPA
jgi:hypothetical protein